MKLNSTQIAAFLREPDPKIQVFLVYGTNTELVRERARKLIHKFVEDIDDPFRIAKPSAADIRDDPVRLVDEMGSLSMTGGPRVIWIRGGGNFLADSIVLLDNVTGHSENIVVIESADLSPRDKLRKICEKVKYAAAIPCYADDELSIVKVIKNGFEKYGIQPDNESINVLVAKLTVDRGIAQQEIEKIALYKADDGDATVRLSDIEACVGDIGPFTRDNIAFATLSGDLLKLEEHIGRCWLHGDSAISILRSVSRHIDRLQFVIIERQEGSMNAAINRLKPPVFFKNLSSFRAQLTLWTASRLSRARHILMEAEIDCKKTGYPSQAICHRALIRIARAARTELPN